MHQQIPEPPQLPEDDECCQNGCDELCVFEIYKLQKANYDAKYAQAHTDATDD
ncbi:MAG: oxidoreductase-like domain-containing protein [Moraxella sp.]|nr:oxidoreductase-like domain-containing protein [Moraxella sp.]